MIRFTTASLPLLAWLLNLFLVPVAPAEEVQTNAEVIQADHHDTSLPAWQLAAISPQRAASRTVIPLHRRPGPPIESTQPDPVLQEISGPEQVATTNLLNFDGVSDRDGVAPPDTNASVGATQVVETVNTSYQVFSKSTGLSIFGPAEISSIWAGFGGVCQTGPDYSDPVVLYDKLAGRWLITIIASNNGFASGIECVAVSTTSDATGSYNRYSFSFGSGKLGDYPKFGVWPDAYYASYNVFTTISFVGAKVCAYNRANMLLGKAATAVCFQRSAADFSFLPSDLDGTGVATTGEPNFFVELNTSTTLNLFKFHVNFSGGSTFTGPSSITVASYSEACGGGTCIPQSGTSQKLDSLGDRLMFRLAYRNFTDHEALVATHSVQAGNVASGARWYEIRSPNSTPVVFQQGTFSSTSTAFWMGSIGEDKVGDIALGYSQSSSTIHPGIAYTGRIPTDALGTMETPDTIFSGAGSQTGGLSRWGDYSSLSIDPSDDCTFWYAQEYIPSNGSFNWHTRLASFKFTGCK